MKNKDLIYIGSIPKITLDYALSHVVENNWTDAAVAESRIKSYGLETKTKEIRDASVGLIDEEFNKLLRENISPLVERYAVINKINISKLEGYHIVKYEKGQFFKEHIDQTQEFPRKISVVFYLNDNYDGGTITFTKIGFSLKPSSGSVLVFPSTEEFCHSADPIISGTKYAIVGFWL